MIEIRTALVDDWYDGLNDGYKHKLPFVLIAAYIDAINIEDYD